MKAQASNGYTGIARQWAMVKQPIFAASPYREK